MQQRNQSAKRGGADSKGGKPSDSGSPASNPPSGPVQQPPGASGGASRFLFIALAVLAFAGMAYWYLSGTEATQQAAAPGGAPPAPPVTVSAPLIETIQEWNDFTGQFEAEESVEIRARVSGYLEQVNFDDGQLVQKGDLLFVVEPRPFEIALESAKADVAQAEAQLELAKVQLERTAELRKKDFASAQAFDERAAEVKDATASLNKARADLDQAQLNLDYTRVLAPVSGRVGRHEVSVGNLIVGGTSAPETTLLTTVVSLDPIWLTFNVSEGDAMTYKRLIQKGELQSARTSDISVEGQLIDEKDWPLKGAIDFVDNQYSPTTGTIRVRASFPNKDLFISPGQFGRVRVPMSQEKPTMLVPDAAVVTDQSTKLLFTVADDGTVVPKPVELGAVTDDGLRIVREGITKDDKVIINGLLRARPGQKVTPKPGEIQPLGQQAAAQR
ncbi:MAG: efflux RND transporter periplasmic adaptor subunit [Pseudomonadota bacterium]